LNSSWSKPKCTPVRSHFLFKKLRPLSIAFLIKGRVRLFGSSTGAVVDSTMSLTRRLPCRWRSRRRMRDAPCRAEQGEVGPRLCYTRAVSPDKRSAGDRVLMWKRSRPCGTMCRDMSRGAQASLSQGPPPGGSEDSTHQRIRYLVVANKWRATHL
jgi:hypothetical protein